MARPPRRPAARPGLPVILGLLALLALAPAVALPAGAGDYDRLRVASEQRLPGLPAGPGRSGLFLAPDGSRALHVRGRACLVGLAAPGPAPGPCSPRCLPVRGDGDLLRSPDGAHALLPLRGEALLFFRDTDIRVLDAAMLSVAVLTEDGFAGSLLKGPARLDHPARWRDAGTILFVRQEVPAGGWKARGPADLLAVDLAGSVTVVLPAIAAATGFVTALDVAPGGAAIAFLIEDRERPGAAGLHLVRPGETAARRLGPASALPGTPDALAFSADGRFLAVIDEGPQRLEVTLVETATGAAAPVLRGLPVRGIAWSPAGAALAYIRGEAPGSARPPGLYLAEPPAAPGRLLHAGRLMPPFCCAEPLVWARNDTMILGSLDRTDAPVLLRFVR